MENLLKNCPCCGGKKNEVTPTSDHFYIQCHNLDCGLSGGVAKTINDAILKWNKRINNEGK